MFTPQVITKEVHYSVHECGLDAHTIQENTAEREVWFFLISFCTSHGLTLASVPNPGSLYFQERLIRISELSKHEYTPLNSATPKQVYLQA